MDLNKSELQETIELFFTELSNGTIEIYNEFSLQHELGIFLRQALKDKKVEFERNVSHFNLQKSDFIKREIDISIYSHESKDAVIELKYPRNGQYPEQMFSFIKDLKFLEQLAQSEFNLGILVIVVDDPLFYKGKSDGIYKYFRSHTKLSGSIEKPTGTVSEQINLSDQYQVNWIEINQAMKYCILATAPEGNVTQNPE